MEDHTNQTFQPRLHRTKEANDLAARACFEGILILQDGTLKGQLFAELIHYFNEGMVEIGFVGSSGSRFENVTLFEEGRVWDKTFFPAYRIHKLAK